MFTQNKRSRLSLMLATAMVVSVFSGNYAGTSKAQTTSTTALAKVAEATATPAAETASAEPSASTTPSATPSATAKPKASATPVPAPKFSTFMVNKTKALEKKKSFQVVVKGVKYAKGVKGVLFRIYNSKGKKVYSKNGTAKNASKTKFTADIKFKKLNYKFDTYTVKAYVVPTTGKKRQLPDVAIADMKVINGSLKIKRNNNATTTFKLTNAYIPGNIKSAEFKIYQLGNKKKKVGTYTVTKTAGKSSISVKASNVDVGRYSVKAYGYSTWGKKVLLAEDNYRINKKHMGKNGWVYEKYAGKKYKFYYINNVKQTDLTKILKLKKSGPSHTNNFYIEVNRAACTVTIFMKNKDTGKYDIPVKTCTVCVGRDTSTVAGTGSLHEHSSYTPIGTYSICSNGISVKYSLKEMHEPDGSVCYARWASHIVGNVYFHSIAVGAPSHNSLPSYRFNLLGSPASAGCIRMAVADAKWIYDYASTGSTVKIKVGSSKKPGPLGKLAMPKSNGVNYDPTDPAISDSQKKKDYAAKRISGYMKKNGKKVGY
ncbi:L,D-transpeptidase family protein [Eubacterium xylanophilum]|uniref:L,D-transpeptidase family protein n=1 Tax=Eubacterium xylanophilum TaxID=39497 RepID=UPI00047EA300|nr:GBS Bsp-like repeat-containing protein [Eubacterium xylanophilum]